jgi:hypothetical protein
MARIELFLLFKYFWVAFILVTFVNGAIWWSRSKPHRIRDPALTESYRSLIRGFVIWGNIPWLVMGAGIVFGGVPSIFHYFDPKSPNPFIAAWFGSVFFLWIAGCYWLFARGGAEELIRHPGLIQPQMSSPSAIKALWVLCLAGGVFGVALMYFGDFKPPEF